MISTVLLEARTQIAWYQVHYPLRYAAYQADIDAVCHAMEQLQRKLMAIVTLDDLLNAEEDAS